MNKIIKIKQIPERKWYVTTDTHLGHNRPFIIEARGYKTVVEHDDAVINGINAVVRPNDILTHLGDVCLHTTKDKLEEYLSRINCQNIYMLWGNHNNPIWGLYQEQIKKWLYSNDDGYNTPEGGTPHIFDHEPEIYPFRYKNVVFLGNYAEMVVDGKYFVLSHFPYYVFNEMKDGAMNLCGHSHYSCELSKAEDPRSKILDVGWDGHAKPLSLNEVLTMMSKKGIMEVDHHRKGGPTSGE